MGVENLRSPEPKRRQKKRSPTSPQSSIRVPQVARPVSPSKRSPLSPTWAARRLPGKLGNSSKPAARYVEGQRDLENSDFPASSVTGIMAIVDQRHQRSSPPLTSDDIKPDPDRDEVPVPIIDFAQVAQPAPREDVAMLDADFTMDAETTAQAGPAAKQPSPAVGHVAPQPVASQPVKPWERWDDVEVFDVDNKEAANLEYFDLKKSNFRSWPQQAKKFPDDSLDSPNLAPYLGSLKSFIAWLDTIDITPKLHGRIEPYYKAVQKKENRFPQFIIDRFKGTYDGWKAIDFGKGVEEDVGAADSGDEIEDHDQQLTSPSTAVFASQRSRPSGNTPASITRFPPEDHEIWGEDGPMHGLLRAKQGNRWTTCLDWRYKKIPPNVFGNNGLKVGDWWPMQLAALRNGAHGSKQGGIAGSKDTGAPSIVISGSIYADADIDNFETVWYSGSESHGNTQNVLPDMSNATLALKKSMDDGRQVRVLRREHRGSRWAPAHGIRYDGLYRVLKMETATNPKTGGVYRRFLLKRLDKQISFEQIVAKQDLIKQAEIVQGIKQGYSSRDTDCL